MCKPRVGAGIARPPVYEYARTHNQYLNRPQDAVSIFQMPSRGHGTPWPYGCGGF